MDERVFISPEQLRVDSFRLASQVFRDGFKPDFMVALWRGGAPIGCFVHEFLKWQGLKVDHIAIRTSRYTGIDQAEEEVRVHSTSYLCDNLKPGMCILLVDDVWDSGTSIHAFLEKLKGELKFPPGQLDVRIAVLYYKPKRNKLSIRPRYFLHESEDWLVFPHELEGMSPEEIERVMGKEIRNLL